MAFLDEKHFRQFAASLEAAIARFQTQNQEEAQLDRLELQRNQLKRLVELENRFRKTLIRHPWGPSVYRRFMEFILVDRKNILAARPFFRERQETFSSSISEALKRQSDKGLYKFRVNYSFVLFALKCHKWPEGGKIAQIAKEIDLLRSQILETNLPLAISQTRLFWGNTPQSHLSYMDLIQIHCLGLLIAIDKFVPPVEKGMTKNEELAAYRKFRAVAIGRMIGDRIEQYSETLIHYWPGEKRKIYRANKARRKFGDDFVKIAEAVNEGETDKAYRTTPEEIASLLASASTVSGDVSVDPDGETTLDRYEAHEESRPDHTTEELDARISVRAQFQHLSVLERKLLALKGVVL